MCNKPDTSYLHNVMAFENCNPPKSFALPFSSSFPRFFILAAILCLHCCSDCASCESVRKTYIVHVNRPPPDHVGSHRDWHDAFLTQLGISTNGGQAHSGLVYSYTHVMSGFAARLTEEELEAIKNVDGFVHAEPDRQDSYVHTTHSPAFLGLSPGRDRFWGGGAGYGRGVIIGVVDTGVDPTHPSFSDDTGMAPPPPRWKGKCEFHDSSLCNNKLIGARLFDHRNITRSPEPFDDNGHGTHTAGTTAGRFVRDASMLGSARGTAAGIAPDAWVAVYKLGNIRGSKLSDSDIMAAINSAVEDGVDVLSMSIGVRALQPLYNRSTTIATFGAIRNDVFVSVSAGNNGPSMQTVGNTAPWMLTVGASTIDRRIRSVVVLGNGEELEGQSGYQPTNFTSSFLPLVYPKPMVDDIFASLCNNLTTLVRYNVKGKLVICETAEQDGIDRMSNKWKNVETAGGVGMILINSKNSGFDIHALAISLSMPTAYISYFDKNKLLKYMLLEDNPTASILFKGTEIGSEHSIPAPSVASFSSRGPSIVNSGILKPDIIGPGVDILAAAPKQVSNSLGQLDFVFLSGTSMSCPHLSGIAALLKSVYPDWTPAMIKSAMMTTADFKNLKGAPITDLVENKRADFFSTGAGHVNPQRAINPGLVYDIKSEDYVAYLCSLKYSDKQVRMITMERTSCSAFGAMSEADLNYPSLTVIFSSPSNSSGSSTRKQVARRVTNVGEPFSSYKVRISRPPGILVIVQPEILYFTEVGQQQSYIVMFEPSYTEPPPTWFSEGLLTWVSYDEKITVNSPISVLFGDPSA